MSRPEGQLVYISQTERPELIEQETGRKLTIDKSRIRRIYELTVSQHNLARLATDFASLRDLGLFKDGEYPFSISIADLELVTELCNGPEIFLHYIEKRLSTQQLDTRINADEVELFGAYLDTRLQPKRLLQHQKGKKKYDFISLQGWQDQIDEWMMYKRGDLSTRPTIRLEVPEEIEAILVELRKRKNDQAKWIAFTLLDLPDEMLSAIAHGLKEIRRANFSPGFLKRLIHQNDDTVICITASLDVPLYLLQEKAERNALVEKYRRKAQKCIGFGIKSYG